MRFQTNSYAPNSILARNSQVKRYLDTIALFSYDYNPVPCSNYQAVLYATWLVQSLMYSSITNYLSGLNNFLHQNGQKGLDYTYFVLSSLLKGIKRKLGNSPRHAIPVLPSMLISIFSYLTTNPGHNVWRAAMLCCFRGLLW